MSDRITLHDLDRALEAYTKALEAAGITYTGRIGIDQGSKTYGRAYRLYLTDVPWPCQERQYRNVTTGQTGRWAPDLATTDGGMDDVRIVYDWDHDGCYRCQGTKVETNSGYHRPPIGDDFLGMTKREAYETLVTRTALIYDVVGALER